MALDTYANLKTAIADTIDRDDLTNQIDDFIDIAEARHKDEIRIREMLQRVQSTASKRFLSLPARFLEMKTLRLLTDPVTVLEPVNLDGMNRRRRESTGKPAYFTVHEEIEFDRTPDQSYTAEMIYYAEFQPLSASNPTNGLLARRPDAYLYAALLASAPFLVHDERIPTWNDLYTLARDGLNGTMRRSQHPGPLVSRVVGATP